MAGWEKHVETGGPQAEWALDMLLSRPSIDPDDSPVWGAFLELSRDRPKEHLGGGMGPTIRLPGNIETEKIRREGRRLEMRGEDLDEFVAKIRGIDDVYVEVNGLRIAAEARAAALRAAQTAKR